MKTRPRLVLALSLLTFLAASASAEPLEKLARKLEAGLKGQPVKLMAVLSFPYHDGPRAAAPPSCRSA